MPEVNTASILALDQSAPFVVDLTRTLADHGVRAKIESIQPGWADSGRAKLKSDIVALDVPSILGSRPIDQSAVTQFVLKSALTEKKLVIGDSSSAIELKANMNGKNVREDVWQKLNLHAIDLARHFGDLENITQHWVDSHIRKTEVTFPNALHLDFVLRQPLRYGENPHQIGSLYRFANDRRPGVANAVQVQGKQLSFNNINDTDAAYECVAEFDPNRTAACVIVKHANPCGVAEGITLVEAYQKALICDPVSAFGGIVALNRPLDREAAQAITEIFTEVIIAPGASEEAKEVIAAKKNLRLLIVDGLPDPRTPSLVFRSVAGGLLVQSRDHATVDDMHLRPVTEREPTDEELKDLKFAFRVVKHVKSNAIVYAKGGATIGIGAGQMSRVDAARIAAGKARDRAKRAAELLLLGPSIDECVAASDAFFPFEDGLEEVIRAGARAVIQPGGSVRDNEIIRVANSNKVAMVFTDTLHTRSAHNSTADKEHWVQNTRHFRH